MNTNISRRWFIGGLASFGALGGNRIFRAHAGTFSGGKGNRPAVPAADKDVFVLDFPADQLPQGVEFRLAVRPVNSLGKPGAPLVSGWLPVINAQA